MSVRVAYGRYTLWEIYKLLNPQIQVSRQKLFQIFFSESYGKIVQVPNAVSQITSPFFFDCLSGLVSETVLG